MIIGPHFLYCTYFSPKCVIRFFSSNRMAVKIYPVASRAKSKCAADMTGVARKAISQPLMKSAVRTALPAGEPTLQIKPPMAATAIPAASGKGWQIIHRRCVQWAPELFWSTIFLMQDVPLYYVAMQIIKADQH